MAIRKTIKVSDLKVSKGSSAAIKGGKKKAK